MPECLSSLQWRLISISTQPIYLSPPLGEVYFMKSTQRRFWLDPIGENCGTLITGGVVGIKGFFMVQMQICLSWWNLQLWFNWRGLEEISIIALIWRSLVRLPQISWQENRGEEYSLDRRREEKRIPSRKPNPSPGVLDAPNPQP